MSDPSNQRTTMNDTPDRDASAAIVIPRTGVTRQQLQAAASVMAYFHSRRCLTPTAQKQP